MAVLFHYRPKIDRGASQSHSNNRDYDSGPLSGFIQGASAKVARRASDRKLRDY